MVIFAFNLIMFAVIELPLLALVLLPERARSLTQKLNNWMTVHGRTVIVTVTGTIGIYLLISGITDLT